MFQTPLAVDVIMLLTVQQVFLNIVLDDAQEEDKDGNHTKMGMCVIRGNSVVLLEAMERIGGDEKGGRRG